MKVQLCACVLLVTVVYAIDVHCPPKEEVPTFHPDPDDCTVYYQCSNGKPIKLVCPPETVFNPQVNVCDHPVNVPGCNAGSKNYP